MSKFFIERPILANVIAIVTILLGVVCLLNLPVAQYPEIVPPTIQVSTSYPGASAEVVASTVGIPIEQAVNGVEEFDLYAIHQRQRRQLYAHRHLRGWHRLSMPRSRWSRTRSTAPCRNCPTPFRPRASVSRKSAPTSC